VTQGDFIKLQGNKKELLAYWNKSLPGTTLGTALIFLAECGLISEIYGVSSLDIAVDARAHNINNILEGEFRVLNAGDIKDAALSVFDSLENVNQIFVCGGLQGFQNLSRMMKDSHLQWPEEGRIGYDTTMIVQSLYKQVGMFKPLIFRPELNRWSNEIIKNISDGNPIVGLHLKSSNDNNSLGEISLAAQNVWYEFILILSTRSNVKFILLGDDNVDKQIQELPNIVQANKLGANNFAKHLVLLSMCNGFMGMMSSLCNLVLFSKIPYVIFKNPGHHKDEMMSEIGLKNHYSFATKCQKVLRVNETPEVLLKSLSKMPLSI